jgi:amidohydrolase
MELDTDKPTVRETASLEELLVMIRRHLHAHPELGFQEFETAQYLKEILRAQGLEVRGPVAGTGLYVDIHGEHPGPGIGYRADMDALPIQDIKKVPYASTRPGLAHLCGHDAHSAIAAGVAILLRDLREHMHGWIRVFFQPNEEGIPSGAEKMVQEGVLEGLSAVYGCHMDPALPVGSFGFRSGPITAASDAFVARVRGTSTGHSARPHLIPDVIWITSQMLNTLYQLSGRVHDARHTSVLTLTRIHAGDALNVMPDEVEFGGSLRTVHREERALMKQKITDVITSMAALHGVKVDLQFRVGAPPVYNDARMMDLVEETVRNLFGPEAVVLVPEPSMGSEDFAFYTDQVPGAFLRIGTVGGPETSYPLHDARFDIDESVLPHATRLMAHVLLRHLESDLVVP